jgi:hypothetical protein
MPLGHLLDQKVIYMKFDGLTKLNIMMKSYQAVYENTSKKV